MPRYNAEKSAPVQREAAESPRWSGIGIHAVAAASIYADHGESRAKSQGERAGAPFGGPDYATD